MTKEIKLHIGYVGKTRAGDKVEMVRHPNDDFTYLFYGSNGMAYYRYGECKSCPSEDTNDIIGPWEETVMTNVVNNYNVVGDKIDPNDGKWHGWNGGDCPVHPKTEVEAVYTSSSLNDLDSDSGAADRFVWGHCGNFDIISFRVTKAWEEPKEPREFWITGRGSFGEVWSECPEGRTGFIHVKETRND